VATLNLIIQSLHNIARWGVVILGVIVLIRAFSGWFGNKSFTAADNKVGLLFTMVFDIQVLLGLILFFTKGWLGVLTADFGAAMSTGATRYFTLEHPLMMLLAVVFAHVGRSQSQKADTDLKKHARAARWYLLSFVVLLASIPWPFMANARPWLRLFGISF